MSIDELDIISAIIKTNITHILERTKFTDIDKDTMHPLKSLHDNFSQMLTTNSVKAFNSFKQTKPDAYQPVILNKSKHKAKLLRNRVPSMDLTESHIMNNSGDGQNPLDIYANKSKQYKVFFLPINERCSDPRSY